MAEGKKTSSVFFFGVVVVAALVVLGYGARQWWAGNTPYPSGSQGGPVAAATDFIVSEPSKPVPDASFTDPGGGMHKLTDFKGTYVLVNFWATWCAPCKTELPSLARLKAAVAPDKLKVVTISIDKNAQIAKKYLASKGLSDLDSYTDSSLDLSTALSADGVPTTVLIDPDSNIIGRHVGATEWDSPDMVAALTKIISKS
jgi:thiol-disulfide isomerase/thioredoxin